LLGIEEEEAPTSTTLSHVNLSPAGTIELLAKERRHLRCQRQARDDTIEKLKAKVTELKDYISDLENHLEKVEEEGIDLRKEKDALLSDDEDYLEDMNMEDQEDEGDDEFIDEEEKDAHVVDIGDESEDLDV
jgi:type IV secretory pathway VirB4 component